MEKPQPLFATLPPSWTKALRKAGFVEPIDVVTHFPLRIEDWQSPQKVAEWRHRQIATVEGEIVQTREAFGGRHKQLLVYLRDDDGDEALLRFFRTNPALSQSLHEGRRLRARGTVQQTRQGWEMAHPKLQSAHTPARAVAVYPGLKRMSGEIFRRTVEHLLQDDRWLATTPVRDASFAGEAWPTAKALRMAHGLCDGNPLPAADDDLWRRLRFEEMLAHQIALRRHYHRQRQEARPLATEAQWKRDWLASLPFALTAAQRRVVGEISDDIAGHRPMRRLLQGDVGSGKTVVAAYACLLAAKNGQTAAFMAPTEILAQQHYQGLSELLGAVNVHCEIITGAMGKRQRNEAENRLRFGISSVVVGTHALFQESVSVPRLALAVIDEQHRFGVDQRQALVDKNKGVHQLMMSATPIPRTLAISLFADVDVSLLDEKPAGRKIVRTLLVDSGRQQEVLTRTAGHVASGGQAYWVCPRIEESEGEELRDVESLATLAEQRHPEMGTRILHGKMKSAEKKEIMRAFRDGEFGLLVATTVIEVGVDVPQADVMIIERADRMGLSQLHQLRGRVGRGGREGSCLLLYHAPLSPDARKRLQIMRAHDDGFEIARQDLALRGPGEWLGNRQSGLPALRVARLPEDEDIATAARRTADWMLRHDRRGCVRHLHRWLPHLRSPAKNSQE